MVVLYKEGAHVTDVTIQHDGEIAIGSGGIGGEFYMLIPAEERPKLLSALADASECNLPEKMSDYKASETILALFFLLFGAKAEDPYVDIGKFLKTHNVPYKGDYWPDR